jgi:hypothetical protein
VLGVQPALGRFFVPNEDAVPWARPAVVVSHAYWQRYLGAESGGAAARPGRQRCRPAHCRNRAGKVRRCPHARRRATLGHLRGVRPRVP